MDLSPYIEGLQRDLAAAAAPAGAEVARAAELLAGSVEASARLCLLEALSDAAAEITTKLGTATVDVRLRGREADLTVTSVQPPAEEQLTTALPADGGELARITLRLPEGLKERAEQAAAIEGVSVNAWLVRAVLRAALAIRSADPMPPGATIPPIPQMPSSRRSGRHISGYTQA